MVTSRERCVDGCSDDDDLGTARVDSLKEDGPTRDALFCLVTRRWVGRYYPHLTMVLAVPLSDDSFPICLHAPETTRILDVIFLFPSKKKVQI